MKLKLTLAAFAVIAAACGSAVAEIAPTTTAAPSMESMTPGDDMGDMGAMNMGDPNAVPAAAVGGDLVTGTFRVLGSAPAGLDRVQGLAQLARHDGGTTVTINFENLVPARDYVAHVHAGSCFDDGGSHYQFEAGGSVMPPNEIHLAFTSQADGTGFMTAENHMVASRDATAVVVHQRTENAPKIACADLR
ncbi:MAG: superoxide dismutase family protein [Acidimicrobiia bacterium]|nr:superoxide dismutase family protein [Acidimicrobiia bacterium]